MNADHRREVALFRYSLAREALSLSASERGQLVRELAEREHVGPGGELVRVSRGTLDRWVRALRKGGFQALVPVAREGVPTTPARVLELAVALKREAPARTAAQIAQIICERDGRSPNERTLQRHFVRLGLNISPARGPAALGRFQADAPNELWLGDAMHGPVVGGHKAILFAFLDDHSRAFTGYHFGRFEDVVRLEAAFRAGLLSRGVPGALYVDNGSPYVSSQLLRACAVLGIRLIHSRPGRPQGRGKIERVFSTVRGKFLVEIAARGGVTDLGELNRLFAAWVEQVYHRLVHSETGERPIERFLAHGAPATPAPGLLTEAFLWSESRVVSPTATVDLHTNRYEVDLALTGRLVDLVFDPFDLEHVQVRFHGRAMGLAVPQKITRHVHPRARRDPQQDNPPAATGIDYLAMVAERQRERLHRRIDYTALPGEPPEPEQHPSREDHQR